MAEVRVHLKDIVRLMLDSPLETAYIRRAQPLFAGALYEMQTVFTEFAPLHILNDTGRAVRRAVVDDEYLKINRQLHHSRDDSLDIFLLVVSGYND